MSVLNGWAIGLGAAAILLPVLIHFFTRPRPRSRPLSTIRFLQQAVEQRKAGRWLRDLLVLLFRSAALACLAIVFARPLWQQESDRSLADALAEATARPERIDVQAAVNAAAEMLSIRSTNENEDKVASELVIVSDFQRSNWSTVDFSVLPQTTRIRLQSVGSTEPMDKVAILDVGFAEPPVVGAVATLEVTVANYCRSANLVEVQAVWDDQVLQLQQMCPPGVKTVLTGDVTIPSGGWKTGWAMLKQNEDVLAIDDRFPFVIQAAEQPAIALISRQPPGLKPSASYFLQRALEPISDERSSAQSIVKRIGAGRFSLDAVAGSQLLVFDHPGQLEAEQVRLLASLLLCGRGVLYVASELIDATNLKRLSTELGSQWQPPVELQPSLTDRRQPLAISDVKSNQPPFRSLGQALVSSLADLRLSGGLVSRHLPDTLDDGLLATRSDQSAWLFFSSIGSGNMCVFNADLDDGQLPRHPVFVPLLTELTGMLGRSNRNREDALCGEPLTRLLPADVSASSGDLTVSHADVRSNEQHDQTESTGVIRQTGDGMVWNWDRPGGPSGWTVKQNGQTVYALATQLPDEESDLRLLDADVMTDRLAGGRRVSFSRVAEVKARKDDVWNHFAIAGLLLLLAEILVLQRSGM